MGYCIHKKIKHYVGMIISVREEQPSKAYAEMLLREVGRIVETR